MKRTTRRTRIRPRNVATDEKRLIERARRGDRQAFDQLVREHYPRVHATAFRLLGNHEDAEDLAQECFVRAHRGLESYRGEAGLSAWLRRIVVHLARDRYRRRGRRPDMQSLSDVLGPVADRRSTREPVHELKQHELSLLVAEAVGRLPDHLRIALVLRTREGLSYDEIAESSGVTPATARTQVMKARRALLRTLEPYLERKES